jgi:mannose-1-phosphate guanylyltransferase
MQAVIMAGGRGTRFWPKSRSRLPKQFLNIVGDRSMLRQTCDRITPVTGASGIWVVTNADYVDLVKEQLPEIPDDQILAEPFVRSTAPCIGLAALHIRKKIGDHERMAVFPSDHFIPDADEFRRCLSPCLDLEKRQGGLITIGIRPTMAETAYGYIETGVRIEEGAHRVARFREKPDRATAEAFLADGRHLWNSGIFIWSVATILAEIERHASALYSGLTELYPYLRTPEEKHYLNRVYETLPTISIDYAVMERAETIHTITGTFAWSDVGSWSAVEPFWNRDDRSNAFRGNILSVDTSGSIVESQDRLIALIGLENLIVIDTPDALLICRKDRDQDIRKIIEQVEKQGWNKYL